MAKGIFLWGFFASSPVVATVSKPTKPKKHFAAPAITPVIPKGRNPPSPAFGGTWSFGICQFLTSATKSSCLEIHHLKCWSVNSLSYVLFTYLYLIQQIQQ